MNFYIRQFYSNFSQSVHLYW